MAFSVPAADIYVRPKYNLSDEITEGYNHVAVKWGSPTTTQSPNGESRFLMAPWCVRSGIKSDTWWVVGEDWIDPAWDTANQGAWGTGCWNFHNSSYDEEGIGWNWGAGTSSLQLDYIGGALKIHCEHGNSGLVVKSNYAKDTWHSIVMKITLGRTDITSYTNSQGTFAVSPGRVQVWLDGSDTPIDTGPTNTVQRAVNPSTGRTILQGLMMNWAQHYTKNTTTVLHRKITAQRVGRTLSEALADSNITFYQDSVSDTYNPNAPGSDFGPSSYTIFSRQSTDLVVPASLGGSAPPVTPTVFGEWTSALQVNAGVTSGTPETPTTVVHGAGNWTGVQRVNASSFPTPDEGEPTAAPALAHGVRRTLTFTGKR